MTTYKPKPQYNPNKDTKPSTIEIGISLITIEEYTFEQDGRAVTCPVDDDITYISVPREVAFLPCGGASYEIIADILDTQGYPRRLWKISSVWIPMPNHIADEIF